MAAHSTESSCVSLVRVVFDDMRPWVALQSDLGPPASWTADVITTRLRGNLLHFRGNYACVLAGWCCICAVRHPFSAFWIALIVAGQFYALVLRRGVLNLPLPNGSQLTLMHPQLHASLGLGTIAALWLLGRVTFVVALLVPPMALTAAHAVLRMPPNRKCVCRSLPSCLEQACRLHVPLRLDACHQRRLHTARCTGLARASHCAYLAPRVWAVTWSALPRSSTPHCMQRFAVSCLITRRRLKEALQRLSRLHEARSWQGELRRSGKSTGRRERRELRGGAMTPPMVDESSIVHDCTGAQVQVQGQVQVPRGRAYRWPHMWGEAMLWPHTDWPHRPLDQSSATSS